MNPHAVDIQRLLKLRLPLIRIDDIPNQLFFYMYFLLLGIRMSKNEKNYERYNYGEFI